MLTSNKGFDEWGGVGDEITAGALIDRLLCHGHIVNIRGNSYRMCNHRNLLGARPTTPRGGRGMTPRALHSTPLSTARIG